MNTTSVEQNKNTQSCLVQLDSKGNIQWISLNPNPIQFYTSQLCESLTERDTVVIYKQAIIKTWKLLQPLLALVFSVFLLAVALLISIWGIGYSLGGQFQKWLDKEYELNLIKLDSVYAIPNAEKNLVIVAKIADYYHFRIFDRIGKKVIDKGPDKFVPDETLVKQLDAAFNSPEIANQIKSELIQKITSSLNHTQEGPQPEEFVTELLKILLLPFKKIGEWANKYVQEHLPGWKPVDCQFFGTKKKP